MSTPTIIIEGLGPAAVHNIYCIGRNYEEHAKELQNPVPKTEPVVFLKSSACLRPLNAGPLAFSGDTFHHEAELVLRVGQHVSLGHKAGWDVIEAIGLGLDLTRRETQTQLKASGLPWTTAKSFGGSALVSPMVRMTDVEGHRQFQFSLKVNGELRQSGNTKDLLFDVPTILTWLATFNVLLPGDLIFTGTPAGVGPIRKGDSFTLELNAPHHVWEGVL